MPSARSSLCRMDGNAPLSWPLEVRNAAERCGTLWLLFFFVVGIVLFLFVVSNNLSNFRCIITYAQCIQFLSSMVVDSTNSYSSARILLKNVASASRSALMFWIVADGMVLGSLCWEP